MNPIFSAPTAINLEITDVCNLRCRHCYNYWREDGTRSSSLTQKTMDELIDIFVDAGIFHVVLTGGEPLARFDILEYGLKKLSDKNISLSCNSNLILATEDKMKRLANAGLDHILTSLNSYDPDTNDNMICQPGAYQRIIKGIETAIKNGIRVSVNMIVSQKNKNHVYETGKLCSNLGCQKIFGTRTVPSVNLTNAQQTDFSMLKEDAIHTIEQLVRIKEDTGIMIGTLVSYPLCLLGDLERYKDFVGRGCPAQKGHVIGINANGDTHACVHESQSYGNVFDIGIYKAYKNMLNWHDGSYMYKGCEGCNYIDICQTGCRLSARAYYGDLNQRDQIMQGKDNFSKHYKIVYDNSIYEKIDNGLRFYVPKRLRFRKEKEFYLVNIRWANTITVNNKVAEFLMKYKALGEDFSLTEFGKENREILALLYFKDVIESKFIRYDDSRSMLGLSTNPLELLGY